MSLHSNKKNFACPKCSAVFIPFKAISQCPKCDNQINAPAEYLDSIDICARSLKDNKARFGSFIPHAWFSGSFADQIQSTIFKLFANVEAQEQNDLNAFIDTALTSSGNEVYLQKHIKEIFFEVKTAYEKLPEIKITPFSKFKERLRKKIRNHLP